MPERLPSDHETVETHRVSVEQVGRSGRPQVVLPDGVDLADGDVVGLALDGEDYFAAVETSLDGDTVLRHVADNRRQARERDGPNRLAEWVDDGGVQLGGSAHFDVVTADHEYGLRTPGKRVVYTATDDPEDSLSDIASDLDG